MNFQALPSSPLAAIATIAAALLAVGLATVLFVRQRQLLTAIPRAPDARPSTASTMPAPISKPMEADALAEPAGPEPAMFVSTFGGFHVRAAGKDWAPDIMSRSVTGFVWLRLLVATILDPKARPGRDEVAQQASPRGSRATQLKRLRNVTSRGLKELPGPLGGRIVVEPETLSFDLDGCAVDAIELLTVSRECSGHSQLSTAQIPRVQRVIDACRGDFLPEFDTLENIATDRRPTCTALVAELRQQLINKRTELSLLLAEALLRDGRPGQAIAVLEPALSDRSERKDIADRLASAYRAAGREAEAKALAARYA